MSKPVAVMLREGEIWNANFAAVLFNDGWAYDGKLRSWRAAANDDWPLCLPRACPFKVPGWDLT